MQFIILVLQRNLGEKVDKLHSFVRGTKVRVDAGLIGIIINGEKSLTLHQGVTLLG